MRINKEASRRRSVGFRLLYLLVGFLLLSAHPKAWAVEVEKFKDFVWPFFESEDLAMKATQTYVEKGSLRDFGNNANKAPWKSILALYQKSLNLKNSQNLIWKVQRVATPSEMPKTHPTAPYYNDHVVWAYQGDAPLAAFRPVDTSTGCHTGCTPVVFHLKIDPKTKKVAAILEEAERPLRKAYHEQLTEADKAKLLDLAQRLPEGLASIEDPLRLTNEDQGTIPQTWTVHTPLLVEKAAFTSYRVYEAALKTAAFFASSSEQDSWIEEHKKSDWISEFFAITNPETGLNLFKKGLSNLEDLQVSPKYKSFIARYLPYLGLWLVKQQNSVEQAQAIVKLLASNSMYQLQYRNDLCTFEKYLSNSDNGRRVLVKIDQDYRATGPSEKNTTKILAKKLDSPLLCTQQSLHENTFLALSQNGASSDELKTYFKNQNLSALPSPSVLKNYRLFEKHLTAVEKILDKNDMIKLSAELSVRFPHADRKVKLPQLSTDDEDLLKRNIDEASKNYKKSLGNLLSFIPRPRFPRIIVKHEGAHTTNTFDPVSTKKQVIVLFASWCPHCQHTIKSWVERKFSKSLWDKIQLIEVFSSGNPSLTDFCKITKMEATLCKKILTLDSKSDQNKNFAEQISLIGVPHILLLDEKGGIALNRWEAPMVVGSDFARDLEWLLDEAKTNNPDLQAPKK